MSLAIQPPVFNSLGSNYSHLFAKHMFQAWLLPKRSRQEKSRQLIATKLGADIQLTFKGREALWLLLQQWKFGPGDIVLTQAFGCYAIEWAIAQVGATPVFVDVEPRQTNMSVQTLELAWLDWQNITASRVRPKIAVLVQHGLGHRVSLAPFRKWCNLHQALLIEDLAQGFSTVQLQKNWQSQADGLIFSFGQDKIIDIGGGGAYLNQKKLAQQSTDTLPLLSHIGRYEHLRAAVYPSLSRLLRRSYGSVLHQVLFRLFRSVGLIRSPIKNVTLSPAQFPEWMLSPLLEQMEELPKNLTHRQHIAAVYHHALSAWEVMPADCQIQPSHLRYTLWVSDPSDFIAYMRDHQVLISDRWYRQPSDSGSLGYHSQYQMGSCPRTEELCHHCVNLPTHRHVSANQAYRISQLAKSWLEMHEKPNV